MTQVEVGQLPADSYGNLPPKSGGTVAVLVKALDYTETGEITIGTLYEGSVHIGTKLVVVTAWNSSVSDVLTVGPATDPDGMVDDADLQSAGTLLDGGDATLPDLATLTPLTRDTDVVCEATSSGTGLNQGAALILVYYIRKEQE